MVGWRRMSKIDTLIAADDDMEMGTWMVANDNCGPVQVGPCMGKSGGTQVAASVFQ